MENFYIHNINPIAINLGSLIIPWYWLFYLLGLIWVCWACYFLYTQKIISFSLPDLISYISWGQFSLLLGGRFFYVIFYHPSYFIKYPENIFKLWLGGMSFHGAIIGISISTYILSKKKNQSFFHFLDLLAITGPIVLFFGRLGNFINGELAGTPTELPWAVIFTKFYDEIPRHPSQIYQALTEGLLTFIILWTFKKKILPHEKLATSLFLILYGTQRFFIEFFRLPDKQLGLTLGMSLGQILCLIMILLGLYLYKKSDFKMKNKTHF